MIGILRSLRDRLFGVNKLNYLMKLESDKQKQISDFNKKEIKAFEILKPYFPKGYLMETSYSLSFQAIQHILNDIIIHKPKSILEFGSGLSTIIIGHFIKENRLDIRFISIDDNQEWQDILKLQGVNAELLCFPLVENHRYSYLGKGNWFNIPEFHQINGEKFQLVIVDAPKGDASPLSRFGFIPFIKDRLLSNPIVYLDDTNRIDETMISQFFLSTMKGEIRSERYLKYTRFSKEQSFSTSPS